MTKSPSQMTFKEAFWDAYAGVRLAGFGVMSAVYAALISASTRKRYKGNAGNIGRLLTAPVHFCTRCQWRLTTHPSRCCEKCWWSKVDNGIVTSLQRRLSE